MYGVLNFSSSAIEGFWGVRAPKTVYVALRGKLPDASSVNPVFKVSICERYESVSMYVLWENLPPEVRRLLYKYQSDREKA